MKIWPSIMVFLIVILLGSGCQHVATPSLTAQQKFFQSIKASNPEEERALRCAQYHNLVGRADLALQELSQAVAADPHNIRLLNAMGNCYDKLGQYAKAQEMYEKVLAQDADNFPARNNLGYSSYLLGDFSRAEKIFQEILAKNPESSMTRNNLGLVWCRQGKESQALSLWQKTDGEIPAKEKLTQVLAYLGKSGNQAASLGIKSNHPQNAAALQSQADPPERESRQAASVCPEPEPATNRLANAVPLQANSARNPHPAGLTGKLSQEPQVKVEEVKMIVQPATYTQATTEETAGKRLIPTPPTAPSQNEKSVTGVNHRPLAKERVLDADLLQDEVETPNPRQYYRRLRQWPRYRQPKIVTCNPPPKESQSIKKFLSNEFNQNHNASSSQESVFY